MIELEGVSFDHTDFRGRTTALLNDLSFHIAPKERVVLLGINGSGKSTLLKLLNALYFPKEGTYRYKGEKMTPRSIKKRSKTFRKEVVFLMQDPNLLLFNATVREEIAFGLREFGFDDIDARVERIAAQFALTRYLETPPFFLSGGEKQRVALAALLAIEPEVLLMDEPSANLDPATTAWLVDLLQEMEITTVTSTHNLSLASELGARTLVLDPSHTLLYDGKLSTFLQDEKRLIEAGLMHKHTHTHDGITHNHYHLHDW